MWRDKECEGCPGLLVKLVYLKLYVGLCEYVTIFAL